MSHPSSKRLSDDQQQQMLERLAYQAWLNRGCPHGSPEVDWHQAINILNTQLTLFVSEQTPSEQRSHHHAERHSVYSELGNDEDTPADPLSLSPFAARANKTGLNGASGANGATLAKPVDPKPTDEPTVDPKRGKRRPRE
jgi:hypothetical protein